MKDFLTFLYAVSIGVWATSLFITIFYNNPIPMWILLIVMNTLLVVKETSN